MAIASIDPGKKGAIVFFNEAGRVDNVLDLPLKEYGSKVKIDGERLKNMILTKGGVHTVILEDVTPAPGDGKASAGIFMKNAGIIEGVILGIGINLVLYRPQKWKAAVGLINKVKAASLGRATQKCPEVAPYLTGVNAVDRADACLIGYTWLLLNGGGR